MQHPPSVGFSPAFFRPLAVFLFLALIPAPLLAQCPPLQQLHAQSVPVRRIPPTGFPVTPDFQGLIDHTPGTWPQVPVNTMRLWDTGTAWYQMNPSQGVYDWHVLDTWLNLGAKHKVTYLLTLGMTPLWAATRSTHLLCKYAAGACQPPDDLNSDGTGTDQHWKDFVTAVAQHVGTRIQYWEIWDEPHQADYFDGTYLQMVRMAQDARTIIQGVNPNALMLNGGVEANDRCGFALRWWSGYAAAGGLDYADILAVHGDVRRSPHRCNVYPIPEYFLTVMQSLEGVLAEFGESNKPMWDTEASWGRTDFDCFNDQDLQASFLARFFLMHLSQGIQRFYWRSWIGSSGGLYDPTKGLNKAGVAYEQIHQWFAGTTLTQACAVNGTVWTCNFTGSAGYVAEAVWDTSKTCFQGICNSAPFQVSPSYVDYRTLDGSKIQIQGNTVPVGIKPIWIEN